MHLVLAVRNGVFFVCRSIVELAVIYNIVCIILYINITVTVAVVKCQVKYSPHVFTALPNSVLRARWATGRLTVVEANFKL